MSRAMFHATRRVRRRLPALALGATCALAFAAPAPGSVATPPMLVPPLSGTGCLALALPTCGPGPALDGAAGVALAPDGSQAFVAGRDAGALTVLNRDAGGGLTVATCIRAGGGAGCTPGRALSGAAGVAVSPDGRLVAVAGRTGAGVAVFLRDPATGSVVQPAGTAGCATETGDAGTCLDGRALTTAQDVSFSPDGGRLYVAAGSPSNAVAVLTVHPWVGITGQPGGAAGCWSESGTDGQCGDGWSLVGLAGVVATPSGVLAVASSSSALVRLTVNPGTGALSQAAGAAGCLREVGNGSCPDGRALAGAGDVAITPDGTTALVAAATSDAVSAVRLDPTLTQPAGAAGCISETGTSGQCLDGRALDGATSVTASGATVYAASSVSDAVAVLGLGATGFTQGSGGAACAAEGAGAGCVVRAGLDGARAVDTDAAGDLIVAADASDAVLALRPSQAPSCTDATLETTWARPATIALSCADPDGDPITLRVVGALRDVEVRVTGTSLRITPEPGHATTGTVVVRASDGALDSAPATVTVRVTAPPPAARPELPQHFTAALLGVERRPLNPRAATTAIPTFCLPRRATTCAGTIELWAGTAVLARADASGPGQVSLPLSAEARRGLERASHAAALLRAGRSTTAPEPDALTIALPVRIPRAGTRLTGGRGVDRLRGGPGDDTLSGRASSDVLGGGAGDDRLFGDGGNDRLSGGAGHDDLSGSFGNDRLHGGAGDDTLRGASGDDRLLGGADADRLDGGTGNDVLEGGPGDDILDGFDGDDTLRGGEGDDYLVESRFGDDKLLDGGPGDDYVDGNRGNDQLVRGGEGNDIVLGGPGSDAVDGGPGADIVDGGPGADPAVRGGSGDDVLVGGRGNDELEGGPGDDVLYGSTGQDTFDCGPGEDWAHVDSEMEARRAVGCEHIIRGDPTRDGVYDPVALVANRGLARGGVLGTRRGSALGDTPRADRPIGTNGDDELTGTEARDHLNGNDGDDLILGLGGNDDLDGGSGDDELRGGEGRDRLFGRMGDDDIHGEAGNDELEGGRGRDTLDGGPGDDTLNGGFDEDVLRGGPGNDRLIAVGGGIDEVDCGPGRDRADVDRGDIVRNCEDVRRH